MCEKVPWNMNETTFFNRAKYRVRIIYQSRISFDLHIVMLWMSKDSPWTAPKRAIMILLTTRVTRFQWKPWPSAWVAGCQIKRPRGRAKGSAASIWNSWIQVLWLCFTNWATTGPGGHWSIEAPSALPLRQCTQSWPCYRRGMLGFFPFWGLHGWAAKRRTNQISRRRSTTDLHMKIHHDKYA